MNKKKKFLDGHKKVGKKLIPPMLQLPNVVMASFREDTIPDLIWLSPFFLRMSDRLAVNTVIDFLIACEEILNSEDIPPLVFLSNFNKLSSIQKQLLIDGLRQKLILKTVLNQLKHQNYLFNDYPLKFLFAAFNDEVNKEESIALLEKDVEVLLDRYSEGATKIQVTAIVSMMATGKMFVSNEIKLPDFNSIFTDTDPDEAKHAASFARASLNGRFDVDSNAELNTWLKSFWKQSFSFSRCK